MRPGTGGTEPDPFSVLLLVIKFQVIFFLIINNSCIINESFRLILFLIIKNSCVNNESSEGGSFLYLVHQLKVKTD